MSRGPLLALGVALALAAGVLGYAAARRAPSSSEHAPASHAAGSPTTTAVPAASDPSAPSPGASEPKSGTQTTHDDRATLEVIVVPYADEVTIDGKSYGKGKVTVRLPPGDHDIRARNRDSTFQRKVTLAAGQRMRVVLR